MKKVALVLFTMTIISTCLCNGLDNTPNKPRVIAMTDGEVDDRCSMVRFLLYTNDIELLAIIQTNSVYQRKGWVEEKWLDRQIDAYEKVYPNLIVHDPDYPTPGALRSLLYVGDNDSSHITVDFNSPARVPGQKPNIDPSKWQDTAGSDRIVEVLLEQDPRPIHIQAWGGGNTAARAFYKLKTQYPSEYKRAISKVVMYNIWYQDGAGSYIEQNHPQVKMLLCHNFNSTWAYGSQSFTQAFVKNVVKKDHGPLGELYTQDYISEGDSPAFLYALQNGLRSDENPTYGGWGGRFYKVKGFENVYRDYDKASYSQWIEAANRDFEARLIWCVTPKYPDANHKPEVTLSVAKDMTVKSGERVTLKAEIIDNDSINYDEMWSKYSALYQQAGLNFERFKSMISTMPKFSPLWWQYKEAGTYNGIVELQNNQSNETQFVAPKVKERATIHIILEVTDNGSPSLTTFNRIIVTINP